jgi:hypothetical protein
MPLHTTGSLAEQLALRSKERVSCVLYLYVHTNAHPGQRTAPSPRPQVQPSVPAPAPAPAPALALQPPAFPCPPANHRQPQPVRSCPTDRRVHQEPARPALRSKPKFCNYRILHPRLSGRVWVMGRGWLVGWLAYWW